MKRSDPDALRARREAVQLQAAALQERKAQMSAKLDQKRQALADRQKPGKKTHEPHSRGLWLSAVLAALLVASLLHKCDPAPPEVTEVTVPCSPEGGGAGQAVEKPQPPPPVSRRSRPPAPPVAAGPLPWIEAFQIQVAARSPRLAACFEGAHSPGTLKWSAAAEPTSGRISDHTVETMLGSPPLTRAQRSCVLSVLSDPGYDLGESGARATPTRVSLVVEF